LLDLAAREILILPADLPFVTSAEIDRLVRAGRRSGFAIAPDARDAGTNGLFLNLQSLFPFQFGEDSKRRHLAAAKRLGLRECVVRAPGLARDIDAPSDIAAVNGDLWQFR
jgi:2-phospho-L-lactate guanylyltransferase